MLKKYKIYKYFFLVIISGILIIYVRPRPLGQAIDSLFNVQENDNFMFIYEALEEFNGSIPIKDIESGENTSLNIDEMEANFLDDYESSRINYPESPYEALIFYSDINDQWVELYLLFQNSQLIFMNTFDYSMDNLTEQGEHYSGFSLIQFKELQFFQHYLSRNNLLDTKLVTYHNNQKISSEILTANLLNLHLEIFENIIDYLDIEDKSLEAFLREYKDQVQLQDIDDSESDLNRQHLQEQFDKLMADWENKWVADSQGFLMNFNQWLNKLNENNKSWSVEDIINQFGTESSRLEQDSLTKLSYALQQDGYQVYEFYFVDNQLIYYTHLQLNDLVFEGISINNQARLKRIREDTLKREELYAILGMPTYQIQYLTLPIQITQWIRYSEGELVSLVLMDNQGQMSFEVFEL